MEAYQVKNGWRISQEYRYQTEIEYHNKYKMHWIECNETRKKDVRAGQTSKAEPESGHFEYLTNIKPDEKNVRAIGFSGRLRWKIENESFNTQKCGDYE
ncbi:MAG: hypothetical protein LBP72_00970, partial [Dysgonamonadaceae bacterium]|nr:hypothetical protein [Dysgonamonadaceae bacterium]